MEKFYLGIDIGTSAVKVMAISDNGQKFKAKQKYSSCDENGFYLAIKDALSLLFKSVNASDIKAVCFSSQVGSYFYGDKF